MLQACLCFSKKKIIVTLFKCIISQIHITQFQNHLPPVQEEVYVCEICMSIGIADAQMAGIFSSRVLSHVRRSNVENAACCRMSEIAQAAAPSQRPAVQCKARGPTKRCSNRKTLIGHSADESLK